jgi:hypothetical protein
MSEAQVAPSSYRSSVDAASYGSSVDALSFKSEPEAYDKAKDRRFLIGALKEQFLLNRYVAASQAENNRNLGLQILFNRMEHMSDKMLLKTIKVLSEMGALDLTAVTGTPVPGGRTPIVAIQQGFGLPRVGSQPASNPVKDTGMLLEAYEHLTAYLRDKAPPQIEQAGMAREGGE